MGDKEIKLQGLIDDIHEIIKPKEKKLTLEDIEMLVDSYSMIKDDKTVYALSLQKHESLMISLEYMLKDEVRIIDLQETIKSAGPIRSKIELEVSNKLNGEELILVNYLYNLIMEAFVDEKNFTVKLYQKEKNKCLQKK